MYMYVYIYIYICIYVYVCVYVYMSYPVEGSEGRAPRLPPWVGERGEVLLLDHPLAL